MTSTEFIETVAGKGYTLHLYTACGLREIHPAGIHAAGRRRRIHPASSVDGYTACSHCLRREQYNLHVHNLGGGKGNTLTSTLLTYGKGYILPDTSGG
jgi:hypothetical protein